MRKKLLFLLGMAFVLILSPFVFAEETIVTSQVAYCEHMGYNISIDSSNKPICVFEDETSCNADEFYRGICGENKTKDFPLRGDGEFVYLEFETCEEGLSIKEPTYLLSLPQCSSPSLWDRFISYWFSS